MNEERDDAQLACLSLCQVPEEGVHIPRNRLVDRLARIPSPSLQAQYHLRADGVGEK